MAIDMSQIRRQLNELQQTQKYKKTYILGKLTNFCCELEILYKIKKYDLRFDLMTLNTDITSIKNIIKQVDEHFGWLQPEDLKFVNKIYKSYKKIIEEVCLKDISFPGFSTCRGVTV